MTPIVDSHTHTYFSDGEPTFDENVHAAVKAGCRVLASTDHLTMPASMDPKAEVQVTEAQLPEHRAAFDAACKLAARIAPNMEMVYGFECDWYEGCEENITRWTTGATFLLGSVHWLGDPGDVHAGGTGAPGTEDVVPAGQPGSGAGWIDDASDLHVWRELGPDEVWRRYVDAWCAACESSVAFDSMAHPDLPMRFANEGFAASIDLEPLWDRMAECARETGRHVEVSTAGLRKSVGDYYPARGLLERFARVGVPITIGSDSHRACDICWGIRDAYAYAASCGYTSFDAPRAGGGWQTFEL